MRKDIDLNRVLDAIVAVRVKGGEYLVGTKSGPSGHPWARVRDRAASANLIRNAADEPFLPDAQVKRVVSAAVAQVGTAKRPRYGMRCARSGDKIYLDPGDDTYKCIEVSADGVREGVVSPIPFIRGDRSEAQPKSIFPGDATKFFSFFDGAGLGGQRKIFTAILYWLSAPERDGLPILSLIGEYSAGKSTAARMIRMLIDPVDGEIGNLPDKENDLMAVAFDGWVLAFDDVFDPSNKMVKAVGKASSGAVFGGRAPHTAASSSAMTIRRPVILTSIDHVSTRGDFASRCLIVEMGPSTKFSTVSELMDAWEAACPEIHGGLVTVLSGVLKRLAQVKIPVEAVSRSTEFTRFAIAVEEEMGWPTGTAVTLLRDNARAAARSALNDHPVLLAILDYLAQGKMLERVPVSKLLSILGLSDHRRDPRWPKTPATLGTVLTELRRDLQQVGVVVEKHTGMPGNWSHAYSIRLAPNGWDGGGPPTGSSQPDTGHPTGSEDFSEALEASPPQPGKVEEDHNPSPACGSPPPPNHVPLEPEVGDESDSWMVQKQTGLAVVTERSNQETPMAPDHSEAAISPLPIERSTCPALPAAVGSSGAMKPCSSEASASVQHPSGRAIAGTRARGGPTEIGRTRGKLSRPDLADYWDSSDSGPAPPRAEQRSARLSEEQKREIMSLWLKRVPKVSIARQVGVSVSSVYRHTPPFDLQFRKVLSAAKRLKRRIVEEVGVERARRGLKELFGDFAECGSVEAFDEIFASIGREQAWAAEKDKMLGVLDEEAMVKQMEARRPADASVKGTEEVIDHLPENPFRHDWGKKGDFSGLDFS